MSENIIKLRNRPSVLSYSSVVGKKESDGPLGTLFDYIDKTDTFDMPTWEQSEGEMQRIAFNIALEKGGFTPRDIDTIFAGDLVNQCTSSGYGLANFDVQFFGLYGACSTMAESLILASMLVDRGIYKHTAAITSSHNCSAERQFRFPLEYGGQRTPTAQWTVTGSAAVILGEHNKPPYIADVMAGKVCDKGINDTANMGAAMAPAAADTLLRYFNESGKSPDDFDRIFTGDLGVEGSGILIDLLGEKGYNIKNVHRDCGMIIYDLKKQDVHAGGSGCGCSATVLTSYIIPKMKKLEFKEVLFMATGAMMSPTSIQQGLTIPSIAHLVHFTMSDNLE